MRLVLGAVLVAILAGSAHAQGASTAPAAAPPPASPASADGASPAPAVTPPSVVAPAPPPPPDRPYVAPNPVAEFLIGGAAGAVGLFGGAFVGYGVSCIGGCHDEFASLAGALVGAALGLTTGTAAGVALTGTDRDHEGSFGWAWLGAAAGATGAALATSRADDETAIAFMIGGAALGATVMFDLTRTRRKPSTALRLVPLISGGGFQLALVGAR